MDELFRKGGPHQIRRTGKDQYQMHVSLPTDQHGMMARECSSSECSPAYFKVKPGTGITEGHDEAFCPYCRESGAPDGFTTRAQIEYAKNIVTNEALGGVDRMVHKALGLGPSGKKKLGGDFISMEMSYKPSRRRSPSRPLEEELRRDVTCPKCTLEHSVFGLATWCPDCGADIFLTHVEAELDVVRRMLGSVERRILELGARVGARDVENALEDTVSIFEAVLKFITRRHLIDSGTPSEEVDDIFRKKVRNTYQSVIRGSELFEELLGRKIFEGVAQSDVELLSLTFEKRHPITHNLGVLDRKYLEKACTGELEGREIRVTQEEVEAAISLCLSAITVAYSRVFPG